MITLTFPDGAQRQYDSGITGREIVDGIAKSLAKRTIAMGAPLCRLRQPYSGGDPDSRRVGRDIRSLIFGCCEGVQGAAALSGRPVGRWRWSGHSCRIARKTGAAHTARIPRRWG